MRTAVWIIGTAFTRKPKFSFFDLPKRDHAAHLCEEYRTFERLEAPTRRRVLPLLFGHKPVPGPILVAIDVHDIRPVSSIQLMEVPA
jgi:hypothetical protein